MPSLCWLAAAGLFLGGPLPIAAQTGTVTVDTVLARARRWLGPATLERVRSIRVAAEVTSPSGYLYTVIRSRFDGRVRFEQYGADGPKFVAGIGRSGPWTWSLERGGGEAATTAVATVLVGHEYHLLTAHPASRWTSPQLVGREVVEGDTLWRVAFKDQLGATVGIRYADDGRPVDVLLINHSGRGSPEVRVRLFDWPAAGDGPRLFRHAVLFHGSQTWLYHYVTLEADTSGDAAFEPSAPIDAPVRMESTEGCH